MLDIYSLFSFGGLVQVSFRYQSLSQTTATVVREKLESGHKYDQNNHLRADSGVTVTSKNWAAMMIALKIPINGFEP